MGENLRHLLRMVLEYFGLEFQPEVLCYSEDVGCKKKRRRKSLIRIIGSNLPLKPCRRVCFQTLQDNTYNLKKGRKPTFIDDECEPLPLATLADVPWIEIFSPEKTAVARTEYRGSYKRMGRRYRPVQLVQPVQKEMAATPIESPVRQIKTPVKELPTPDPVSLKKIDALEEELAKLRAQIAMIVTTQQSYPVPAPPPPCGALAPPPPPPPCGVPPPPPPPAIVQAKQYSIKDQIRKNKALKGDTDGDSSKDFKTPKCGGVPNMAEVLKGLGSVKLRSIARSPGGTPIRQAPKPTNATDAAALIAQALKKKFAHRLVASPNKENNPTREFTPSPNRSPKIGPHMLKSQKRSSITGKKPLKPINV